MPSELEFDKIFNDLIKPPIEESGYEVIRAQDILSSRNILKDIIRNIYVADLVIADLTTINPNVFYELGIAHALERPTVLLTQSIEDVPFDLKSYRVIIYSTKYDNVKVLKNKLIEIANSAKNNDLNFGNPVTDFKPKEKIEKLPDKKKEEIVEEYKEKGFIDFIVDTENCSNEIINITNVITNETKNIGNKMKLRTDELNQISDKRIPGTASRIQRIIKSASLDILNQSSRLEDVQPEFHKKWVELDDNMRGFLEIVKIRNEDDKKEIINFKNGIYSLKDALSKSSNGIIEFKKSVNNLRGMNRELNLASNKTVRILDLIISDMQGAEAYTNKILTLAEEKLK